jgi:glycosyltransferase involved in cell wall biosynthesis
MKVAVVVGVSVMHDAISSAAVEQVSALQETPEVHDVRLFTQWLERDPGCPSQAIANPWELLRHPEFRSCDVAIFHWGIHYALFDAITLLLSSPTAPSPVVHFHNCTPPSLAEDDQREQLSRSIEQLHHVIDLGVPIWTYSEFNRRTLIEWGAQERQIGCVTFPVSTPRPRTQRRCSETVQLLSVGRLVPAKGTHVLLDALALLPDHLLERIRTRIVSSTTFSSSEYGEALEAQIRTARPLLAQAVEFLTSPSDAELDDIYREAHVVISPSFHEGLCVPVIEGYAVGCRAIGTTAGNLPYVVIEPDPVVPPGDPVALAGAIESVVANLELDDPAYHRRRRELVESFSREQASQLLRRGLSDVTRR